LVEIDEHPDDPDLKRLSAAVQAIRETPDPQLFQQLVQELHDPTCSMQTLLEQILFNDRNLLKIKPWNRQKEAIAVKACIGALPLAQKDARQNLIEMVLRLCGGGKIEIEGDDGGNSVEVIQDGDSHTVTLGGAEKPLPLEEAQKELRRMYSKANAGQPQSGSR